MSSKNVSQPVYKVKIEKNILIPMRDGITLAADAYIPEAEGKFPAIIGYYGPYHKDMNMLSHLHDRGIYFAQRGYYVFFVDVRGTGNSEGYTTRPYSDQEQQDGYEVVEWLAKQPWCNGNVGMMGMSYGFYSTVLVAATTPPHLKAIIPFSGGVDWYDAGWGYEGGNLGVFHFCGFYCSMMLAFNSIPPIYHDPKGRWVRVWEQHLQNNMPYLFDWMENDVDGPYYHIASVCKRYDKIKAAAMVINGWHDFYPTWPIIFFLNIKVPKRLIAGPWMHESPDRARPGPRIDIFHEQLRWMDQWLKGKDTGVLDEPPIALYVQEYTHPDELRDPVTSIQKGRWRYEDEFPPKGTTFKPLHLHGNGILDWSTPSEDRGQNSLRYDPTAGIAAGLIGGVYDTIGMPIDQRFEDPFALTYTTQPLEDDLEVTGQPLTVLYFSSSADITAFTAKLCDVAPDGTTVLVTRRSLNATHRESHSNPSLLKPGTIYELKIAMEATSYLFQKGHRIKLYIACAEFPYLWPTPKPAINTIYHGSLYPSRIELPIVPKRENPKEPKFLPPPPVDIYENREMIVPHYWKVSRDMRKKSASVEWGNVMKVKPDEETFVEIERRVTVTANNTDRPADVVLDSLGRVIITKPSGTIDTQGKIYIRSDEHLFHTLADLYITYDGKPYFHKEWRKYYPRKFR